MTSKPPLSLDLPQLLDIIPHVFLPRKLPASEQPKIVEIEQNILRILNAVASHGESLDFSSIAPQTSLMLQNWEKLQPCLSSIIYEENEIGKTISSLNCKGMLAFYIRAQNAGMLLSGSMDESNDNLVLSTFPASAPSTTVMSTSGDLAVAVPQQSVWIPRTTLLQSRELSDELRCLNITQIEKTLPIVSKARNKFGEIRDVANPKLITDWLTLTLCKEDSGEAMEFPMVQKKIRDDVMWNGGLLPFRRSGLWFTAKVAIHTFLIRELGEELGKAVFKTFMIKVMNFVLTELSQQSTHEWDIKMQMMAKIARRIEKLKQQHLMLLSRPTNGGLVNKVRTWVNTVENNVFLNLKNLRITMDAEWMTISSSQFHPVADIQLTPDQIGRDLPHSMPILTTEIKKRNQPPQRQTSRGGIAKPTCPNRLHPSKDFFPKVPSAAGYAGDFELWEVEIWVAKNISSYVKKALSDTTVSSTIRDFITSYATKATSQYTGDPVATSRKVLTILRCLRVLDEIACREHPILLEHKSGIDLIVFHHLLLPFKSDMEEAFSLEQYFLQRDRKSKYESFMDENEPSDSSVSVRFAKKSKEMCECRNEILKKEKEEIAAKEEEIKQAKDRCEALSQRISLTSCEYHYSSYYEKRVHSDGRCSKCSLEDQHKRAEHSVSRYEKPLPSSQLKQFAVVFDLLIPSTVACLRDMLHFFRAKVCNDSSLSRDDRVHRYWKDYHRVSHYWKGNNQIIFLGSTTKATLDTHYRQIPSVLSLGQSSFILDNGMTHLVFRANTSQSSKIGSLKKQCTLQMNHRISPSYRYMQWAIDSCSHTSNSVLARQNTCHADMSLGEFYHFGCLRAGHRIQYRNLFMSLSSGKLSLKTEAVCQLICQAMWEAGVPGGDALRESHIDFSCEAFGGETVFLLDRLISENSENWSEPYILITLISISARLLELSPHASIKMRASDLMRKARGIACKWTQVIRRLLAEAYNARDEDKLKLKYKLIDTAFVVASSFCVDAPHVDLVIDTAEDLLGWLSSLSVLYDEILREFVGVSNSLSATKLIFLRRIINTGVNLESKISTIVAQHHKVLSQFTKERWNAAKDFTSSWVSLGGRRQVYECQHVVSEEGSTHVVHIDILLGKFLVDGCPVGKLPEAIVSTQEYQRVFETAHFQVQKDQTGVFTTLEIYGHIYSFCLSPENYLVAKETTTKVPQRKLELIPHGCFENVMPVNFMDKFSHWWDSAQNKIHFRKKSFKNPTFSASPEFSLNLNDMILAENATGRKLISCTSESYFLLIEILKRIECPQFIHIWQDKQGEVEIELVRLGLKFRLEGHKIVSHEYPGYFISSNQNLHILVGFRNLVVLEGPTISPFIQPSHQVIIAHALIQNSSMGHHQTVEINLNTLRHPTFFTYEVDSRLRILKAGRSHAAWLYLAALHAATSSPLPDYFSGLTGTEMSLTILQSARCWSCQPYDAETLTSLGFIKSLSPCRTYYPPHLRCMEKVNWSANLPSIAAHDGFALIVDKLIQDSGQLSILHASSNSSKKIQEATSKEDETKIDLRLRHYWRQIPFSNEAATISNKLHPELYKTQPTIVKHIYGIVFQFESASRVTSHFNHSKQHHLSEEIITEIRRLLLQPTPLIGLSLPLPAHQLSEFPFPNVTTWIEMDLRNNWINLYNVALNVQKNGWEMKWAMVLSSLAFKGVSLNPLLLLQTVERNPSNFPAPLYYTKYDNPCSVYSNDEIKSILRQHSSGFPNSPKDYTTHSIYLQALAIWNAQIESDVQSFAADVHNQWPSQKYIPRVSGSKVSIIDAAKAINARFIKWNQNIQLKEFIARTEGALRLTIAGRSLLPQVPPLNLSSPEIAIHPRYMINFEELVTVDMSQSQNGKFAEEMFMKGTWKGICDCASDHPIDALSRIECKEDSLQRLQELQNGIWEDFLTHVAPETRVGALVAADLYPRLVPIKLLPFILDTNKNDSSWTLTRNAIGAVAVLWTLEQRLIRCLTYIHAGTSMEVALKRELDTIGHESWSPKDQPGWLILELEVGMMIRTIQHKVANEMLMPSSGKNSVMQLNMGEGKTCLIVPMLAISLANEDQMCRVTILKSIFETNFNSLRYTLGGLLDQKVYSVPCRRDLSIEEAAPNILEIYKHCMKNRGIVVTLPEHRLSFQLKGYDNAYRAGKEAQAKSLIEIQRWIDQNTRDILDESDEILSVKYQLVYTMGSQIHMAGGSLRWIMAQKLLKILPKRMVDLWEEYGDSGVEVNRIGLESSPESFSHCRLLQKDCYQRLISWLADDFLNGKIISSFPQLKKDQIALVRTFLTGLSVSFDGRSVQMTPREHQNALDVFKEDSDHLEQILILAGYLRYEVLFVALSKRWKVNYGVNPNGFRKMAVPFKAKDVASERTEFGHPDMAIVLTQLSYYYSGLSDDQLHQCFDYLNLKQQKTNPAEVYASWLATIPDDKIDASVKSYTGINLDDYNQKTKHLFPMLRRAKIVIDFWLSIFVFPKESKQFPGKLTCTAWDLSSQNHRLLTTGFSGTNDSSQLLPSTIQQNDLDELQDTNRKLEGVLSQAENDSYLALPPPGKLSSTITMSEHIIQSLVNKNIKVLLDCGALMLEMNNEQVARKWLELSPTIEGVVFFNDKNILTVKMRGSRKDCPLDLSPFRERLDTCAVYLDDEHTRGTDLKFPRGSKACVTVGSGLTRDKLVQACMRMRQLGVGHTVTFWASHEAHSKIKGATGCGEDCSSKNVLHWVKQNSNEFVETGLVYWTVSALNYCRKLAAEKMAGFGESNMQRFGELCVEDEMMKLMDMYGQVRNQKRFVEIIPSWFESLLKSFVLSFLRNDGIMLSEEVGAIFKQISAAVVARCKELIPDKCHFTLLLDEEQEKELENELEEEKEPDPPRPATPNQHSLHPTVLSVIQSGTVSHVRRLDDSSGAIQLLPLGFENTKLSRDFAVQVNCWGNQVLVTSDFINSIVRTNVNENVDEFLRPLAWVASLGKNPEEVRLLVISPYEADELIPIFRAGKMNSVLHLYTPRLLAGQKDILIDKERLNLPPVPVSIPRQVLAPLSLFSGILYFHDAEEETIFAEFLGIIPRQGRSSTQERAFDEGKIARNGFVLPMHRSDLMGMPATSGFQTNPETLVKEILRTRNQGNIQEGSHVHKLAVDGMCSHRVE